MGLSFTSEGVFPFETGLYKTLYESYVVDYNTHFFTIGEWNDLYTSIGQSHYDA